MVLYNTHTDKVHSTMIYYYALFQSVTNSHNISSYVRKLSELCYSGMHAEKNKSMISPFKFLTANDFQSVSVISG